MNRSEFKLIKSLAVLVRRHSVKDWSHVARLLGLDTPLSSIRTAISGIIDIEAEERRKAVYEQDEDETKRPRTNKPKSPKGSESKSNGQGLVPKKSISGEEFGKWLEIISPTRPSNTTQFEKPQPKKKRPAKS